MEVTNRVERRRAFLINAAFYAVILGLFYLFMNVAFWPLFPFLLAFTAAILLQRPVGFLTRKTPLKRGFASTLLVVGFLLAFGALLTLIGAKLFSQIQGFMEYLRIRIENLPALLEEIKGYVLQFLSFLPDTIEKTVDQALSTFFDKLVVGTGGDADVSSLGLNLSFLSGPLKGAWSAVSQIPAVFLASLVSIICCIFMTIDYPRITAFLRRQLPEKRRDVFSTTKKIVSTTIGKLLKTYLLIICITFIELMIGFKVLDLLNVFDGRYTIVLALAIAVVDILPVLGTGTILTPWAIYSFIIGNTGLGIGLLVIYLSITVIRQFVEPKLVSSQLGLPPFVTLIAMYFGLKLFGFIGLFLMPMLIILLKILNDNGTIRLWKTGAPKAPEEGATPADTDGDGSVSLVEDLEQNIREETGETNPPEGNNSDAEEKKPE